MSGENDSKMCLALEKESLSDKDSYFHWRKIFKLQIVLALLAIFVAYISSSYKPMIYDQLDKFKLIPRSENYTELYFENYSDLGSVIYRGKIVDFSFSIRNVEGGDMEYPYAVYLENSDGKIVIDQGSVSLKNNEYKNISESFKADDPYLDATLFVELAGKNQKIHFHL